MSPISLVVCLTSYALVGVWRLSQDLFQPPFNQPQYVRDRDLKCMLLVVASWPIVILRFGKSGGQRVLDLVAANPDEFTFKSTFKHTSSVPTTSIKSLAPFVSFPFWSWGILIEHSCPEQVSPIYFGTVGRPSRVMKRLASLPFKPGVQIDRSTMKGPFPC
jgi:hypothetical protein